MRQCPECGRPFKSRSGLAYHRVQEHLSTLSPDTSTHIARQPSTEVAKTVEPQLTTTVEPPLAKSLRQDPAKKETIPEDPSQAVTDRLFALYKGIEDFVLKPLPRKRPR